MRFDHFTPLVLTKGVVDQKSLTNQPCSSTRRTGSVNHTKTIDKVKATGRVLERVRVHQFNFYKNLKPENYTELPCSILPKLHHL